MNSAAPYLFDELEVTGQGRSQHQAMHQHSKPVHPEAQVVTLAIREHKVPKQPLPAPCRVSLLHSRRKVPIATQQHEGFRNVVLLQR